MDIPIQSPLYRSIYKDRYSRQEKINKIEELTGRKLIVYVTNMNHPLGFLIEMILPRLLISCNL